jgi:imidazole glycerol phosphate synthase subunit HisF
VIYSLIILLRQEGLGYRKISRKLNQWGIKTHRGKQWFNTSVSSVLKRKHEYDLRIQQTSTGQSPIDLAQKAEKFGAGEVIINSIDNDGVMGGYDFVIWMSSGIRAARLIDR